MCRYARSIACVAEVLNTIYESAGINIAFTIGSHKSGVQSNAAPLQCCGQLHKSAKVSLFVNN